MAQLTDNHWAVEVPDDANDFEVQYYNVRNQIEKRDGKMLVWASLQVTHNFWILPPGSWQYLFTTKGCSEEQAATVVEKRNDLRGGIYKGYEPTKLTACWNAKQSLDSLLRSKGCDINKNFAIIQKQNDNA